MIDGSYKLKIEWANLETYFTHLDSENNITEWYGYEAFKHFLNNTEYPFCIKEVEYNADIFLSQEGFGSNINVLILHYHKRYKMQNCNFLAIDKDSNKQIFLRCNDLAFFPKYFENWIIYEIYYSSTPHHILEYYNLKKELEFLTNHSQYFTYLPLAKMMYLTLCIDEVNYDNYKSELIQSILVEFERIFKNKKNIFEIKDSIQSKLSWMRFCKSVRSSYVQAELDQVFDYNTGFSPNRIFKNMNSIETVMASNTGLNDKLKHAQFFNEFLKTDNTENTLLSTLPIPLNNKNSTLIVK